MKRLLLVILLSQVRTDWGPDTPYGGRPYEPWEIPDSDRYDPHYVTTIQAPKPPQIKPSQEKLNKEPLYDL